MFLQLYLRGLGPTSTQVSLKWGRLRPSLLGTGKPLPGLCLSVGVTILLYEAERWTPGLADANGPSSASPWAQPFATQHSDLLTPKWGVLCQPQQSGRIPCAPERKVACKPEGAVGRHISADVKNINCHFPPGSAFIFQIPQLNSQPQLMTMVKFPSGNTAPGS